MDSDNSTKQTTWVRLMSSVKSMKNKEKAEVEKKSWKDIFYNFTQETTLHGLRYITERSNFLARRFLWLMVFLTMFGLFLFFVINQLLYLIGKPKSVNVEVIFSTTVTFPAVTICNQNFFRRSAAYHYGVYDMIENAYSGTSQLAEQDVETVTSGFELTRNHTLEGMESSYTLYAGITATVCRQLCLDVNSDSCCSLLYDWTTRACYITPLEASMDEVSLQPQQGVIYYKRRKCELKTESSCDFDGEGFCSFVEDTSQDLTWQLVKAEDRLSTSWPSMDHTNISEKGNYIHVDADFERADAIARLWSPYILSTSEHCIHFYHQTRLGGLAVKLSLKDVIEPIYSRRASSSTQWERLQVQLPKGYFRILLEASTGTVGDRKGANVAVDDLYIGKCQETPKCRDSKMAVDYSGGINAASSGRECVPWLSIPSYRIPKLWNYGIVRLDPGDKQCRNVDADINGPWCVTNVQNMAIEYCNLPYCACRDTEHRCGDGMCLAPDLVCDDVIHCNDRSDEQNCGRLESVNCTFSNAINCSYYNVDSYTMKWTMKPSDDDGGHMAVDGSTASLGDIASLISPPFNLTSQGCLAIDVQLTYPNLLQTLAVDPQSEAAIMLCSVLGVNGSEWQRMYLDLRDGYQQIRLDAVWMEPADTGSIMVDNVSVLPQDCFFYNELGLPGNVDFTTEYPEMTSEGDYSEEDDIISDRTTIADTNVEGTTVDPHTANADVICNENSTETNRTSQNCTTASSLEIGDDWSFGDTTDNVDPVEILQKLSCDPNETCKACLRLSPKVDLLYDYYYATSNTHWMYKQNYYRHVLNKTTNSDVGTGDTYMYADYTENGTEAKYGQWLRIQSPAMSRSESSCLRFFYNSRYMDIMVTRADQFGESSVVLNISHDGGAAVWHQVTADLAAGDNFHLQLWFTFTQPSINSSKLDNITVVAEDCYSTSVGGSVNCTFDTDDWCGYHDVTQGGRHWFRSHASSNDQRAYFLRTTKTYGLGKMIQAIRSPNFTIAEPSCLRFHYFAQSSRNGDVNTVSVMTSSDKGDDVVWSVHGITHNAWNSGQTMLPAGNYSVTFMVIGEDYHGGIDDITITPGQCQEYNCSGFWCSSHETCFPLPNVCDGVSNCYGGEDELDCPVGEEGSSDDDELTQKPLAPSIIEGKHAPLNMTGENLGLTGLYTQVGHQREDFIYKCEWHGEPCTYANFTPIITDYGMCYVFNKDHLKYLQTAETGARFGLRITLNLEQYEYMAGPNTDAGIKVFLHPQPDIAQVRDLGFAISPGQHALVGVTRNDANNLEKPWGDCFYKDLLYYDTYRLSYCDMECATNRLNKTCQCRDAFMPVDDNGNPQVCDIDTYFNCVVKTLDTIDQEACECPKPCAQVVYEPSLSYATLSIMNVNQLLTSNNDIALKFSTALETRQHTDAAIYVDDIQTFTYIINLYDTLSTFVRTYISEEKSVFEAIYDASYEIKDIFKNDLDVNVADIVLYKQTYISNYQDAISLIERYETKTQNALQDILFGFKMYELGSEDDMFLYDAWDRAIIAVSQNKVIFDYVSDLTNSLADNVKDSIKSFFPETFLLKRKTCPLDEYNTTLLEIDSFLRSVERKDLVPQSWDSVRKQFEIYQDMHHEYQTQIAVCRTDYINNINAIITMTSTIKEHVDGLMTDGPSMWYDFAVEVKAVDTDKKLLKDEFERYKLGGITKDELLQSFASDTGQNEAGNHVTAFADRLRSQVSGRLRTLLTQVSSELQAAYLEMMKFCSVLEPHLTPNHFYTRAIEMTLWRLPSPNLEDPARYDTAQRELYNIWESGISLQTFLDFKAKDYVNEALSVYFSPLLDEIDEFELQLLTHQTNLEKVITNTMSKAEEYFEAQVIDKTFISENFLNMDVYFKQLKYQVVSQQKAYDSLDFLSDIGGYVGLLLGASVMTVFEFVDVILYKGLNNWYMKKQKRRAKTNASLGAEHGHSNSAIAHDDVVAEVTHV